MENKPDSKRSSICRRIFHAMSPRHVFRPSRPTIASTGRPPKYTESGDSVAVPVPIHREVGLGGSNGTAGDHVENQFSDYIKRAKAKFRTFSNVSGGKKERKDSAGGKTDEHFTSFIDKTKKKLRTTSSIGSGEKRSL
ncbi:hypothetical protein SAY86_010261 [Trapa natans]|uniref:Uncharacterized protein n=1 Tax=Trapa natans TaxID=22666 RepID=A0AAN7L5Z3_TRANT|nr:hypothetical protein SAY86_010261 [Trapa natans]